MPWPPPIAQVATPYRPGPGPRRRTRTREPNSRTMSSVPGGTPRVPERDRPAVGADPVRVGTQRVKAERVGAGEHLGRERLGDLEDGEVVDGRVRPARARVPTAGTGPEPGRRRVDAGHRGAEDAQPGQARAARTRLRHHGHRRGAVVDAAGVAGGRRPVGPNAGAEPAQRRGGRARPGPVVADHPGDRDQFGVEPTVARRRRPPGRASGPRTRPAVRG